MDSNWDLDKDNQNQAFKFAKCTKEAWDFFDKEMKYKLWRVDGLLLVSAVMAGITVGIGAYGQRYRHHPFTRLIFLGATTLFLPVISSVISLGIGLSPSVIPLSQFEFDKSAPSLTAVCNPATHFVIIWALLIQTIMINTSIVIAVDDSEGPDLGPPIELLPQGAWIIYLGLSYMQIDVKDAGVSRRVYSGEDSYYRNYIHETIVACLLEVSPFLLSLAKLVLKYFAHRKAQQSFAFRHNPCLVSAYMQQLPLGERALVVPPSLLVMGEEARHVEKQPHGYVFKDDCAGTTVLHTATGLVTIDRVWKSLDSHYSNSMLLPLPAPTVQRLKDLCLSFSLFKLLRCQFARYELAYASAQNRTGSIDLKALGLYESKGPLG